MFICYMLAVTVVTSQMIKGKTLDSLLLWLDLIIMCINYAKVSSVSVCVRTPDICTIYHDHDTYGLPITTLPDIHFYYFWLVLCALLYALYLIEHFTEIYRVEWLDSAKTLYAHAWAYSMCTVSYHSLQ